MSKIKADTRKRCFKTKIPINEPRPGVGAGEFDTVYLCATCADRWVLIHRPTVMRDGEPKEFIAEPVLVFAEQTHCDDCKNNIGSDVKQTISRIGINSSRRR